DLRRHQQRRPVEARPRAFNYTLGRFVQRNIGSAVAIVALIAVLVGGIVARTQEARRANLEADRARNALVQAEKLSDFLIGLFEMTDPDRPQDEPVSVDEMLAKAEATMHEELADQPVSRARFLQTIGRIAMTRHELDRAAALYEQALALRDEHQQPGHEEIIRAAGSLGVIYRRQGRSDDAEAMLTEAWTLESGLDRPRSRGETLRRLGRLAHEQGRYDEAETRLTEALSLIDTEATPVRHVATARNDLGYTLLARGHYDRAEAAFRSAATVFASLGDPEALTIRENLAQVHLARGEPERAAAIFERTLAERRQRFGPRHVLVADSAANLGAVRFYLDEIEPAIASTRSAADIWSERLGPDHSRTITGLGNLAGMLSAAERLDEAEALLVDVLERLRRSGRDRHPLAASYRLNLANVHIERGAQTVALPLIEDALAIRRALYPEGHAEIGRALDSLGSVYSNLGYPSCEGDSGRSIEACRMALDAFEEAWVILRDALGPSHPEAYTSGIIYAMHSFDLGGPRTRDTVASLVATGREHPELPERQRAYVLRVLATLRLADGQAAEAEALIAAWRAVGIDWSGDDAEWQEPYADLLVAVARRRRGSEVDPDRVAAAIRALSSPPIADELAVMPGRQAEWLAWREELSRDGDPGASAPDSPGSIDDRR
ncbi:MAG: tetratricopeptide repeat protein, partial [Acidobacteriota bacterium]